MSEKDRNGEAGPSPAKRARVTENEVAMVEQTADQRFRETGLEDEEKRQRRSSDEGERKADEAERETGSKIEEARDTDRKAVEEKATGGNEGETGHIGREDEEERKTSFMDGEEKETGPEDEEERETGPRNEETNKIKGEDGKKNEIGLKVEEVIGSEDDEEGETCLNGEEETCTKEGEDRETCLNDEQEKEKGPNHEEEREAGQNDEEERETSLIDKEERETGPNEEEESDPDDDEERETDQMDEEERETGLMDEEESSPTKNKDSFVHVSMATGKEVSSCEADTSVYCVYGHPLVLFDLETTGFYNETDEITQVAAVAAMASGRVPNFDTYILPERCIPPPVVVKLTGISVREGKVFHDDKEVEFETIEVGLHKFSEWLFETFGKQTVYLGAHNCRKFDSKFLIRALDGCSEVVREQFESRVEGFLDTLPLFQAAFPGLGKWDYRQPILVRLKLGLEYTYNAHNAVDDVTALLDLVKISQATSSMLEDSAFTVQSVRSSL